MLNFLAIRRILNGYLLQPLNNRRRQLTAGNIHRNTGIISRPSVHSPITPPSAFYQYHEYRNGAYGSPMDLSSGEANYI